MCTYNKRVSSSAGGTQHTHWYLSSPQWQKFNQRCSGNDTTDYQEKASACCWRDTTEDLDQNMRRCDLVRWRWRASPRDRLYTGRRPVQGRIWRELGDRDKKFEVSQEPMLCHWSDRAHDDGGGEAFQRHQAWEKWYLYHNILSLMIEKRCMTWMKTKKAVELIYYQRWMLP